MTTATVDIKALSTEQMASMLEALLTDVKPAVTNAVTNAVTKPVTAKVTKTPKVTTVANALPKLEHAGVDYTAIEIPPAEYRPLQAWCKARGIKASGSTAVLRDRAARFLHGETVDMAKVKTSKPRQKKEKAPKRNAFGLNYRTAQKLVSWFKVNMPSAFLPELVKNIGWDNVEANLDALLRTDWFRSMTDKQLKGMAQDVFMTDEMFTAFLTNI